tara:strand:+ start:1259 stop:1576 length:318 start_codon:yes stop_codon:yes gene_type:complete
MKIKKIIICIVTISMLTACNSIRKGFEPNTRGGEEFLVDKKSPLVMPPNYNELPIPGQEKNMQENKKSDIKSLISGSDNQQEQSADNNESISSIEKLILKEIKKN